MKEEKQESTQSQTKKSKKKPVLLTLAGILVVGSAAGGGYYAGLQKGRSEATKIITGKITETLNPLNLLSSNPIFPGSVIGQVTKVESDKITVKKANGEEKTIAIASTTQVTRQSETLKVSDVQKGQQVTVFVKKDGDKETATRIIVR